MKLQLRPQKFNNQLREAVHRLRGVLALARWEGIDGPDVRMLEETLRQCEELARAGEMNTSCGEFDTVAETIQSVAHRRPPVVRAVQRPHRRVRKIRRSEHVAAMPFEPA